MNNYYQSMSQLTSAIEDKPKQKDVNQISKTPPNIFKSITIYSFLGLSILGGVLKLGMFIYQNFYAIVHSPNFLPIFLIISIVFAPASLFWCGFLSEKPRILKWKDVRTIGHLARYVTQCLAILINCFSITTMFIVFLIGICLTLEQCWLLMKKIGKVEFR